MVSIKKRTKTTIRYAKENDREKERERKKGIRRDIEREKERNRGEKDGEVRWIVKGRVKSSLNLPNREIKRKERLITKIMTR